MDKMPHLLAQDEVARRLDVSPRRVKQLLRERQLVEIDEDGGRGIPEDLLQRRDGRLEPLWGLAGTITLLCDGGFSVREAAEWLYTRQDELGECPIDALRRGDHKRVNRAAQILAL